MRTQKEIFQDIFDKVATVLPNDWEQIVLVFQIEGSRCREGHSYTFRNGTQLIEVSVPYLPSLEKLARELRDHLAGGHEMSFTQCEIHFHSNGAFNADYSYEPITWETRLDWYFPDAHHPN